MNAIGLIETKGLIPSIEAADIMLKTAQVELVERSFVGGGIVTITITGDVGAVKAAVDAGVTAVLQFGEEQLRTHHVIPRPHDEVDTLFSLKATTSQENTTVVEVASSESEEAAEKQQLTEEKLNSLSLKQLRELAIQHNNLGLSDKALAMSNKASLLKRFNEKIAKENAQVPKEDKNE